jgi:hypothetical protein
MKNLLFFLSLIVVAVVTWSKDELTTNFITNTSTNTISYDRNNPCRNSKFACGTNSDPHLNYQIVPAQ